MKKKSGAKKARAKKKRKQNKAAPGAPMRFGQEFLMHARQKARQGRAEQINPFIPAVHPPGVEPTRSAGMAMDDGLTPVLNWANSAANLGAYGFGREGFLGWPILSELALRGEYRQIVETIATECTRKWIKFQVASGVKAKAEKIKKLEDELTRLNVKDHFRKLCEQDGYFGRSHLYIDTGATDKKKELLTSIGAGRDKTSLAKIGKGSLKALRTIEAPWVYPLVYNSTDPLKPDWYRPSLWGAMGKEIDESRLLTFIGRDVPDMLKPAYSFGGQPMTQIAKPYVDNWLKTRQGVNDIINAFSVFVLKTNMQATMDQGGDAALFERADAFNLLRDNRGLFVLDKDTEEFDNVSASLAGLEGLQAQAQEHMCAISRIPKVKLLGIDPAGLNASSDGELQSFDTTIGAYQERFFRPNLTRVIDFTMLSLWGEIDEDITFIFEPLEPLNEKELAEVRKLEAETDQVLIDGGVLWPADSRRRVASDPDTPYSGLDVDDLPDLREEEEEGLEPLGGRPDPLAEKGAELQNAA